MRKILWPIIAIVSMVLSTLAFIYGTKVIEKTQNTPPIYITYPEGYKDLADLPAKPKTPDKKSKTKPKNVAH
jgi:hypothetical protein